MKAYESSLTSTYSERQSVPLSRIDHPSSVRGDRPASTRSDVVVSRPEVSSEALQSGQLLRAEVLNRTTTDVTLRLANGQLLQARLEPSVPLSIGQTASFEVMHADSLMISLRIQPEQAYVMQNALIEKALTAAELPFTEHNAELVHALLSHNLPISKESILSLVRQSNAYPDADVNTLALMVKHKLPIHTGSVAQLQAYQTMQHQLLPQLSNLARLLGELTEQTGNPLLFAGKEATLGGSSAAGSSMNMDGSEATLGNPSAAENGMNADGSTLAPTGSGATLESPSAAEREATLGNPSAAENGMNVDGNLLAPTGSEATLGSPSAAANGMNTDGNLLAPARSEATLESPSAAANSMNADGSTLSSTSLKDTLTQFLTANTGNADTASELEQALLSRWTLSAQDLVHPKKLKEFYGKLQEDFSELRNAMRSALQSAKDKSTTSPSLERLLSDAEHATGRLQDNLEFMSMLNRLFPYVQLPLRFHEQTTHGELYVYTKKEKKSTERGGVSVLLHLDMDALGPTDIYLSLSANQLTSRFYLADSSLETLFCEYLPELKETLTQKGFSVSFELVPRNEQPNPVRAFLNTHDDAGLSRFSFDCRA